MGEARVSINFSAGKFTDTGLSTKTNSILDKMDGSTVFVTPSPTLKEVDETNQKYIVALGKVENGTKEATVIKNDLRAILEGLLKQLAEYVQTISKGDEATILSSGFDITRKPGAVGMLAKPSNFTVKPGKNKSSVLGGCDKVDYAIYYEIEYTETPVTPSSIWRQHTSTKSKTEINGLTSGVEYAFRMCGAGSNPNRVWSEIVFSFVL